MSSRELAELVSEMLRKFPLHADLESASLIGKLLSAPLGTDPWGLDLTETECRMLGGVLAGNPEAPTIQEVQSSLAWLGRRRLARLAEQLSRDLRAAEVRRDDDDPTAVDDLLIAKRIVRRGIRLLEKAC
jgi:hypothetical protein